MDKLKMRLDSAMTALSTLEELAVNSTPSRVERDAAIQRFEYTFEAVWKTAKEYLKTIEGIEVGSPKGVVRSCFQVGLLDEQQTRLALQMADDRNLTSHTYHQGLAQQIFVRLKAYANLMGAWLDEIKARMQG